MWAMQAPQVRARRGHAAQHHRLSFRLTALAPRQRIIKGMSAAVAPWSGDRLELRMNLLRRDEHCLFWQTNLIVGLYLVAQYVRRGPLA
jgi:hypothetical protein